MKDEKKYAELPVKVDDAHQGRLAEIRGLKEGMNLVMESLVEVGRKVTRSERELWDEVYEKYKIDPDVHSVLSYDYLTHEIRRREY